MATRYYIEDKNGTIQSEDGTRRFIVLEGQALYEFLQTKEGKEKQFFVYEDNGETIGIEEMKNTTKGETKAERKTRYHYKVKKENHVSEMSLDDQVETGSGKLILLHEIVADRSVDLEKEVVDKISIEELRRARHCLTEEENEFLDLLYSDRGEMTEEEVGKLLGKSHQAIHKRKERLLGYLYIELKRRRR
jgi:hypothetical protein